MASWWRWRARNDRPSAAVYLSGQTAAMAVGHRDGQRCVVRLRADRLGADDGSVARALREQARALAVADAACNLVLAPEAYSLTLVERPPVPDDELKEAVRWRLQETVEFPVEQAALDVFPLPPAASRERPMVFVVTLRRDALKRLLDRVAHAGLRVTSVDVTELALRNLAWALHPEPDRSVALLRLTPGSGLINVTRADQLFLSRRISGIPAELSEAAWQRFDERLLLQVQRSIDYYESAMGQPPCSVLQVATTEGWQDRVCGYLDDMLPLAVQPVNSSLSSLFDVRLHDPQPRELNWQAASAEQRDALAAALPALGGLLRDLGASSTERIGAAA